MNKPLHRTERTKTKCEFLSLIIIISVYNEEKSLIKLHSEIKKTLSKSEWNYKILFINDGSTDGSLETLKKIKRENTNLNINIINLFKNYGHEAAMIAGIDHSDADVAIVMDADLQHPPRYIPIMLKKFLEGNQIVLMKRRKVEGRGIFRSFFTFCFYKFLNLVSQRHIEVNVSDFFLIDKTVINSIKKDYNEMSSFLRGYIQMLGRPKTIITYNAAKRFSGKSKYNSLKLFTLSTNALISLVFTDKRIFTPDTEKRSKYNSPKNDLPKRLNYTVKEIL